MKEDPFNEQDYQPFLPLWWEYGTIIVSSIIVIAYFVYVKYFQ